ncbi:hypothetical protein TWF281_003568 [Arthrobotrys megalospora]
MDPRSSTKRALKAAPLPSLTLYYTQGRLHPSPRPPLRPPASQSVQNTSPKSPKNHQPPSPRTLFGGAYLSSQPTESSSPETWPFAGSSLVLELPEGSGEDAVREWLKNDPYSTGGVWDWENARIVKFKAGVSNVKELSMGGPPAATTESGEGKEEK